MSQSNIRMIIVVRRDLQMPAGLLAAQVSHIGDQWEREHLRSLSMNSVRNPKTPKLSLQQLAWLEAPVVTVLAVDTPEELDLIMLEAGRAKLAIHLWRDTIHSVVLDRFIPNVPVGISIGPDDHDLIKSVTGKLPLL